MSFKGDKNIEEKIRNLSEEVKSKRDTSPPNSKEKLYYRKVSRCLDQTYKKIVEHNINDDN